MKKKKIEAHWLETTISNGVDKKKREEVYRKFQDPNHDVRDEYGNYAYDYGIVGAKGIKQGKLRDLDYIVCKKKPHQFDVDLKDGEGVVIFVPEFTEVTGQKGFFKKRDIVRTIQTQDLLENGSDKPLTAYILYMQRNKLLKNLESDQRSNKKLWYTWLMPQSKYNAKKKKIRKNPRLVLDKAYDVFPYWMNRYLATTDVKSIKLFGEK